MLGALLITGCQSTDPLSTKNDPRSPWWELAFTEPNYMKVWVETLPSKTSKERRFFVRERGPHRVGSQKMEQSQREVGTVWAVPRKQ